MDNILINEEGMNEVISKLDVKIKELVNIYDELSNLISKFDDSSDILKGDTQRKAYEIYSNISKGFPNTVNQMKSLKIFLQNTLLNYLNSDNSLNNDIEKNSDSLGAN